MTRADTNKSVDFMSESHSPTYAYLLSHFGPLLTLKHLAEVMHTTPGGLRMTIARRQQPMAVGLSAARRRLGRRVYFDARRVADLIDADPAQTLGERWSDGWEKANS